MTTTFSLTPQQSAALAPLRCAAAEAADLHTPGLVLGQIWFGKDGAVLVAAFVGHEAGLQLIRTLNPEA